MLESATSGDQVGPGGDSVDEVENVGSDTSPGKGFVPDNQTT